LTTRHRRCALILFGAVAAFALAVDQITKYLAVTELEGRPSVRLFGGLLYLSLLRNSGAAFSMGTSVTFVFPLIAIGVIGVIIWMTLRLRSVPWAIGLGLALGGALGNLADRLFRSPGPFVGHVVDMVSVFAPDGERFPVFNAADSALFCGVLLLVLMELTGRHRDGSRASGADVQPPGLHSAARTERFPRGPPRLHRR